MKVLHLSKSDINGGAARATYRIHRALKKINFESFIGVDDKISDDWTIFKFTYLNNKLRQRVNKIFGEVLHLFFKTGNTALHSYQFFSSGKNSKINQVDASIINLHWVQGEMLSITDIGKIEKPIVWTLHDMWPFCGAEHYSYDERYIDGYKKDNRPAYEKKIDLNRWVWSRKLKHWKKPIHIVAPSNWIAECAKKSKLMSNWPITVIPNAIDTDIWKPINKIEARQLLNLPLDKKLLLFGAMGGGVDPRKGFDLLLKALENIQDNNGDIELIIFGQSEPAQKQNLGFKVHYMGHLNDNISLRLLYSIADVMLIPSRQDNLPNTGVESLACGTPIVGFNTCGLPDIIKHKKTGYLAKAFDISDFSNGIMWILEDKDRQEYLSKSCRNYAVENFSYPVVAQKYINLYNRIIG